MYRDQPGIHRTLVVPGQGVGPAIVGRSTPDEVLASFGSDCQISRYDQPEEIFQISYDHAAEDDYRPNRPAQETRPATFNFEFGLLRTIVIGVYQKGLATEEGVRISSPRAEIVRLLGPPTATLPNEHVDTLRWLDRGIEVDVDHDDDSVTKMTIFRARW